jgi:hypothetical protein
VNEREQQRVVSPNISISKVPFFPFSYLRIRNKLEQKRVKQRNQWNEWPLRGKETVANEKKSVMSKTVKLRRLLPFLLAHM